MPRRALMVLFVLAVSLGPVSANLAQGQTLEDRIKILEETAQKQEETIKEQQKLIKELKAEMEQKRPPVKQAVAQPKEAPLPVAEKSGKTATPSVVKETQLPEAGEAKAAPAAAATSPQTVVLQQQVKDLKDQVGQVVEAQKQEFLSKFNPSIGFVGETLFGYRSQPAKYTFPFPGADIRPGGFDVFQRSMELNLAGSVDPFARAYAVLNASADPITGEASIGVEEAAILTTSLPWNLTVKAGRFSSASSGGCPTSTIMNCPSCSGPWFLIPTSAANPRQTGFSSTGTDLALREPDHGRG